MSQEGERSEDACRHAELMLERREFDAVVKEIEKAGGKAMAAIADVTDAPAVQKMAAAALKQFGRIDYLINNAALRQEKHIEDITFEDWRFIIGVILDGAFHCVKACLEPIKAGGGQKFGIRNGPSQRNKAGIHRILLQPRYRRRDSNWRSLAGRFGNRRRFEMSAGARGDGQFEVGTRRLRASDAPADPDQRDDDENAYGAT